MVTKSDILEWVNMIYSKYHHGDLFVQIVIPIPNDFQVNGVDLITSKRINTLKLVTGCYLNISVPGGANVNLNVSWRNTIGTVLKITGKGLPNRQGNPEIF